MAHGQPSSWLQHDTLLHFRANFSPWKNFVCGVFHAYTVLLKKISAFLRDVENCCVVSFFYENPAWDAPQIMQRFLSEN